MTVHVHNSQGRIYMLLAFTKGNNDIMDVENMCHVQQIATSLRKKENVLLVLDTLILFQMAFKTQEIYFQTN